MTPLNSNQIAELRQEYTELPADYLSHMESYGWGKLRNGRVLYSGPIHPDEVYGDALSSIPILVLGDDTCGNCFGYHCTDKSYGEISPDGNWEPWDQSLTIANYVSHN